MSIIDKHGTVTKQEYNANEKGIHPPTLEEVICRDTAGVYGCTQGVDSRVFSLFEPMDKEVAQEDEILPFRGILLGGIEYLHQPLVQYRWHDTNVWDRKLKFSSLGAAKAWQKKRLKQQLAQRKTWCKDLAVIQGSDGTSPLASKFQGLATLKQTELAMCDQNMFIALLKTLQLMGSGTGVGRSLKIFRRAKLLPWYTILRAKLFARRPSG